MSDAGTAGFGALQGLVVADLSGGVAGQYCGKLMAGHGARVVLVEPPAGAATRFLPPMLPTGPAAQRSLLFRHLNQGKDSVVIDVDTDAGRELLAGVLDRADVVVRDRDAATPPLAETVVDCEIADFPADGPYRGWRGTEMIHQALAGYMNASGHPDRRPLYGVGRRAYYTCGVTAYISVLAALYERTRSGLGQRVGATVFESAAAVGQNFVSQYNYNRTYETRARYAGLLAALRCRDGWVVLFPTRDWAALCRIFDAEGLVDDPRLGATEPAAGYGEAVARAFEDRALSMTADELVERAQRGRISAEKVTSVEQLVQSRQWRERDMWRTVGDPRSGRTERGLAPTVRIAAPHDGSHENAARPSPALGAHQPFVLGTQVGRFER